jgi:hypothetical protein
MELKKSKSIKILKCPECNEYLSSELQEIISQAFLVMMTPARRYLEFNGTPFICEQCFEKQGK